MREAPRRAQRLRLLQLAGAALDRHLEQVSVALREALPGAGGVGPADGLLAGEPAASSVADAARAVHRSAVEAHEVGHQLALALVVDQGGGSAAPVGVVLRARVAADAPGAGAVAVLAVADQPHQPATPAVERAHPVQCERCGVAVGHRGAGVAERHVAEPRGQREHLDAALIALALKRSIRHRPSAVSARVAQGEALQRGQAQQSSPGGGAAGQERAPIERCRHPAPLLGFSPRARTCRTLHRRRALRRRLRATDRAARRARCHGARASQDHAVENHSQRIIRVELQVPAIERDSGYRAALAPSRRLPLRRQPALECGATAHGPPR